MATITLPARSRRQSPARPTPIKHASAKPGGVHSTGHSSALHIVDYTPGGTITLGHGPAVRPHYESGGSGPGSWSGGVSGTSAPGSSFGAPAVSSVPASKSGGGRSSGGRSGGGGHHGGGRSGVTKGGGYSPTGATPIVLNPSPLVPGSGYTPPTVTMTKHQTAAGFGLASEPASGPFTVDLSGGYDPDMNIGHIITHFGGR